MSVRAAITAPGRRTKFLHVVRVIHSITGWAGCWLRPLRCPEIRSTVTNVGTQNCAIGIGVTVGS